MSARTSSINPAEIAHFSKDAADWWDETGPFAPLHRLNPARMEYIHGQICNHFDLDGKSLKPFKNLSILDIGCGGGLVCEPLARLGADVTGADADPVAIDAARAHANETNLTIEYLNKPAEEIGKKFDVVLALEIIEHVTDPADFVRSCTSLLKPGGLLIFSTLNRTMKSYALGIIAAEHILRWVPKGTHDWKKFLKPSELAKFVRQNGLEVRDVSGLVYNPLKQDFHLSQTDTDVNYFISGSAKKF